MQNGYTMMFGGGGPSPSSIVILLLQLGLLIIGVVLIRKQKFKVSLVIPCICITAIILTFLQGYPFDIGFILIILAYVLEYRSAKKKLDAEQSKH